MKPMKKTMNAAVKDKSAAPRPVLFLASTLLLSIPFHVWSVLWPVEGLPFGLPIAVLMIILPAAVATVLTLREAGAQRAVELWLRIGDARRIAGAGWLALALLTMPFASLLAFGIMRACSLPLPETIHVALWRAPVLIAVFFCGAIFEEIGWTGYATEPLQRRYGVTGAGLIIGSVWALWHVPAWWLAQGHTIPWVVGQSVAAIAMRLIMGWIYAAGGRSLCLAVLFHAMNNVSWVLFPNGGSHFDPRVIAPILAAMAAAIVTVGAAGRARQPS
jgi:membrane protease YdiL (CAAX protease family)